MMFYKGQPVVCINGDFTYVNKYYPNVSWPTQGGRYVIRDYVAQTLTGKVCYPAVLLMEIRNRRVHYMDGFLAEVGFWEARFAPATDIGDLRRVITDVDQWMGDHETMPREKEDA